MRLTLTSGETTVDFSLSSDTERAPEPQPVEDEDDE